MRHKSSSPPPPYAQLPLHHPVRTAGGGQPTRNVLLPLAFLSKFAGLLSQRASSRVSYPSYAPEAKRWGGGLVLFFEAPHCCQTEVTHTQSVSQSAIVGPRALPSSSFPPSHSATLGRSVFSRQAPSQHLASCALTGLNVLPQGSWRETERTHRRPNNFDGCFGREDRSSSCSVIARCDKRDRAADWPGCRNSLAHCLLHARRKLFLRQFASVHASRFAKQRTGKERAAAEAKSVRTVEWLAGRGRANCGRREEKCAADEIARARSADGRGWKKYRHTYNCIVHPCRSVTAESSFENLSSGLGRWLAGLRQHKFNTVGYAVN